ncbi:MAG: sulfatase-like hydrolase/transferase [Pseudolabrys sp.]
MRVFRLSPTGALLLAGLLLPNLLTFATLGSFLDVGLPPRTGCILAYCVLAICARRIPFALTAVLFALVLAFDLVWTLSLSFGLRPQELVAAINHARHVRVFDSALYGVVIVVLAATSIGTLYILAQRARLQHARIGALFAAALAFAGVDYASNVSPHYAFGALLGRNAPMESAVNSSGFSTVAGNNGRNAVLVVVESLGYLNDPHARGQIDSPLFDPRITQKYTVTEGKVGYFGSTTSAEMRELCDTREPYDEFARADGYSCLPKRLNMRGYATMAVHGFSQEFFERDEWYPNVGFDKDLFGEDLLAGSKRLCGGAFRGICDADLPPVIAREASFSTKPKFIYWLTLNTHVPVAPGEALADFRCGKSPGVFGHGQVCNMAELWHDVFASVAKLALDPKIGPAEILVVGDHAPPLWSRRARAQFEPGKVPWYRLTPRADTVASAAHEPAAAAR